MPDLKIKQMEFANFQDVTQKKINVPMLKLEKDYYVKT